MLPTLTAAAFAAKWRGTVMTEKAGSREHFIDLCRMVGEPTPPEADPTGVHYAFEKRVEKAGGGDGFADVWKRDFFAWEYHLRVARRSTCTPGRGPSGRWAGSAYAKDRRAPPHRSLEDYWPRDQVEATAGAAGAGTPLMRQGGKCGSRCLSRPQDARPEAELGLGGSLAVVPEDDVVEADPVRVMQLSRSKP